MPVWGKSVYSVLTCIEYFIDLVHFLSSFGAHLILTDLLQSAGTSCSFTVAPHSGSVHCPRGNLGTNL
jgi:hypothetical protein